MAGVVCMVREDDNKYCLYSAEFGEMNNINLRKFVKTEIRP